MDKLIPAFRKSQLAKCNGPDMRDELADSLMEKVFLKSSK